MGADAVSMVAGLELVDLALYLPAHGALAVADVHLGFEEALHEDGTLVPRGHFQDILTRLEAILDRLKVTPGCPLERVLINGDLRHRFGPLTQEEWRQAHTLLEWLQQVAREVIILEGNHDLDRSLKALAAAYEGVHVESACRLGSVLFLHGDEEPRALPPGVDTLVIGHEHPAVGLRDRVTGRVELFKCYLIGPYRGVRLVVQPSLNPWVPGSDLTRERCLSPLLSEARLVEFQVFLVSDRRTVHPFGLVERLLSVEDRIEG